MRDDDALETSEWTGKNAIGKALELVRDELMQESDHLWIIDDCWLNYNPDNYGLFVESTVTLI